MVIIDIAPSDMLVLSWTGCGGVSVMNDGQTSGSNSQ